MTHSFCCWETHILGKLHNPLYGRQGARVQADTLQEKPFRAVLQHPKQMGESKEESTSAGTSAPTVPEKAAAPAHPAASAAPPVQGVPVGAPGYYPQYQAGPGFQQNRPLGYGSYGTQGAPGAAAYPYHSQEPQSFEVHEVHRPQERLPCIIGIQLIL